ncbi:hypothetical protein PVAND_004150 [Polypedilum vanderplanki]|uniref:Zinc finger bed domain-containing protein 1-like n=1 Tax=Polypedilum vanderplanki TaxID=319348 RepID=A0A9J6BW88_POLVA|nr:hypothetical protein PVAND_004150 [Polypedilum vanderplanki]
MNKFNIGEYLCNREKGTNKGHCKQCSAAVLWSRERIASHKRKSCPVPLTENEKDLFAIKKIRRDEQELTFNSNEPIVQNIQLLDADKKDKIDKAFSHFFFRTGISFRVADSDAFRKLIKELNPLYHEVLPNSSKLCTQMLQNEHSKLRDVLDKLLENASELTLTSDGWSNIRGEHLVNFIIQAPNHKPIFYKTINTSGITQTSEAISNEITNVILEVGEKKFCALITDNAVVMRGAWKLIESRFPHISANGCAAHVMNLLIKDIMDISIYKQVATSAGKIIKFINNHHNVLAKFEEIKNDIGVTHKLSLPVTTRWYSHYISINDLINAKYACIKLVDTEPTIADITPKDKSKEVINLIRNNVFWEKAILLAKILEYPTKIIGIFENDSSTLDKVYHYFGELYKHFEHDIVIQQLVKKRWDFIMTESIGISYMLSPASVLNNFYIDDDKIDIMGQIKSIADTRYGDDVGEKVLPEFTKFVDKIKNLNESRKATILNLNAINYWKLIGFNEFPNLYKIASTTCGIPCSSAASERIWSTYRFIHSRLRNRLGNDKIEKLVFIYINCSNLDTCDIEDYISEEIITCSD